MGSGSTRRFRKVYMKIEIKWPINEMGGTHVVKDMI
jgi:hypothetical protein